MMPAETAPMEWFAAADAPVLVACVHQILDVLGRVRFCRFPYPSWVGFTGPQAADTAVAVVGIPVAAAGSLADTAAATVGNRTAETAGASGFALNTAMVRAATSQFSYRFPSFSDTLLDKLPFTRTFTLMFGWDFNWRI